MSNQGRKRGFTLIEAIVVVAIIIVLIGILLPGLKTPRRGAAQLKDSSQLRGIHQSMVQWALMNNEQFPLPSVIDPGGATVDRGQGEDPTQAFRLDSTRNIFSLLVFHGAVPPYMLVSPAEQGPIIEYEGYQISEPVHAADPAKALWDPAFRATPIDSIFGGQAVEEGSVSYAHTPPFGNRRISTWRDTYSSTQAVLGNRGPSWTRAGDAWELLDDPGSDDYKTPVGTGSNTLLIHGSRLKWEGNIAYQDNRVIFETHPDPDELPFMFSNVGTRPDNLFVNEDDATGEPDDERHLNALTDNENAFLRSYSDRITGVHSESLLDVHVEIFYD